MITYPVIFFGAGGPLREDFEDYSVGSLTGYAQGWQYNDHQWLVRRSTSRYTAYTWKDYGVSGAFDAWNDYGIGTISLADTNNFLGVGNFGIREWNNGFSTPYFRDTLGQFTSSDYVTGYGYINFNWQANAPFDGYKSDYWCTKFIGKLMLPISGTYALYVDRDEAARIYVGNEGGPSTLIFNQWGTAVPSPAALEACSQFTYNSGQIDILIHFYENVGNSRLRLYWQKPSTPGGSPTGPISIILPSDFGITGYVREFSVQGAFTDHGANRMSAYGYYVTGRANADKERDYSRQDMNMSGNYSYGIVNMDGRSDYASLSLEAVGKYLYGYSYSDNFDAARSVIQNHGFYAYRSAFSNDRDYATNYTNAAGYHVIGYVTGDDRDYARQSMVAAGHHITGWVNADATLNFAYNTLGYDGLYASRYIIPLQTEATFNTIGQYGIYLPRFVNSNDGDFSFTSVNPSGYYVTGFHNYNDADYAKNEVNPAGYHVYWQVTGDRFLDYSSNSVTTAGAYSFGIAYMSGFMNGGYNQIGFSDSYYRSVYVYAKEMEPAYSILNLAGYSLYRYSNVDDRDCGYGEINCNGNYFNRFAYSSEAEPSYNILNSAGYHVPSNPYSNEAEPAYCRLDMLGDFYYSRMVSREAEPALNYLGIVDSSYFARFVYADRYEDFGRNILLLDGEYYRQAPSTANDAATLSATWSGSYTTAVVNTLDYWASLYETSLFDPVQTKQYFYL